MKHTKGPWEAHISGDGGFGIWADCFVVSSRNGYPEWDKSEVSRANAHLIAAAPELLEALEWALEWIDAVPNDITLPTMPGFDRDYVNDLIAKAKGE